jgi:hypothetical protein
MNRKIIKEFELIQNTPIIHFKPETSIRETELKPALNKFLAQKKKLNVDEFIKKYPFRVKVINNNLKVENIPNRNLLYFGNIGGNDKKFVYADVKLEFFSFKKDVLDLIEKNIDEFLFLHNFGTRKSKGFGSFSLKNSKLKFNKKVYYFECKEKEWMDYLGYFYKFLRSGINEYRKIGNIFYAKPLIFEYACNNNISWEKKRIKKELENIGILSAKRGIGCGENYKIVRDILGLSTVQNWRTYKVKIIKKNRNIERYPSPIMFKPVKIGNSKMRIYFFNRNFEEKLRGRFNVIIKDENNFDLDRVNLDVANLDVNEFLEFVYDKKDEINSFIKHVNGDEGNKIKTILNKIFNNLGVINE